MHRVEDSRILLSRHGAVADLCFNRPDALNAIDVTMARSFLAAVKDIVADTEARAVLLRGAGKGFMAGGDLSVLAADPHGGAASLIEPLHEAMALLMQGNAPVVAQVHGVAAGAGVSLVLNADIALAAEGTRFSFAYSSIGASCDVGASWAMPRMLGLRRSLEIALLNEPFDAKTAEQMGVINRVVQTDQLADQAMEISQRLASGPTVAFGELRRLMRSSFERDLPAQLSAEAASFQVCARTTDFSSAVNAFLAKSRPAFKGS